MVLDVSKVLQDRRSRAVRQAGGERQLVKESVLKVKQLNKFDLPRAWIKAIGQAGKCSCIFVRWSLKVLKDVVSGGWRMLLS